MGEWVSIYWLAPIMAWLAAQLAKMVIARFNGSPKELRPTIVTSGSMPSSHSAITVSLLVVVAVVDGISSAAFGITLVLTSIVIYDALNVRRAVGEQGLILRLIAKDKPFYNAIGHKPIEVVAGSILGVAIAVLMLQIL